MVAPIGVDARIEIIIPVSAHTTEKIAAQIDTPLKLLNILIAETAGKTIKAEVKSEPTRFIASTITVAITVAKIKLYIFTLVPVDFKKPSSKVMQNILL